MPAQPAMYCFNHKKKNMVDVLCYPSDVWTQLSSVPCSLRTVTETLTMKIYVRNRVKTMRENSHYPENPYFLEGPEQDHNFRWFSKMNQALSLCSGNSTNPN